MSSNVQNQTQTMTDGLTDSAYKLVQCELESELLYCDVIAVVITVISNY